MLMKALSGQLKREGKLKVCVCVGGGPGGLSGTMRRGNTERCLLPRPAAVLALMHLSALRCSPHLSLPPTVQVTSEELTYNGLGFSSFVVERTASYIDQVRRGEVGGGGGWGGEWGG